MGAWSAFRIQQSSLEAALSGIYILPESWVPEARAATNKALFIVFRSRGTLKHAPHPTEHSGESHLSRLQSSGALFVGYCVLVLCVVLLRVVCCVLCGVLCCVVLCVACRVVSCCVVVCYVLCSVLVYAWRNGWVSDWLSEGRSEWVSQWGSVRGVV